MSETVCHRSNMLDSCATPGGQLQNTSHRSLLGGGDRRDRRRWIHYEDVVKKRWRKRATPGSIALPAPSRCGKPTQPSMETQSNAPRNNHTRATTIYCLNTHVLANHGPRTVHPLKRVHEPRPPNTPMYSRDTRLCISNQERIHISKKILSFAKPKK